MDLFKEMDENLRVMRENAEQMNLIHVTTELKLRNAVNMLREAEHQMEIYAPDGIEDEEFTDVHRRVSDFLVEFDKSEKQNG